MTKPHRSADLVVFSHLRWDFIFQRPQHLLTRCAQQRHVYYVEEPVFDPGIEPKLHVTSRSEQVHVVVPHLAEGTPAEDIRAHLARLTDDLLREHVEGQYIAWYYTPMALAFTRHLKPAAIVYDCMDELSQFKFAPPELCALEAELFSMADVVFTGGLSLYEHKQHKHPNIHPFPSSVDVAHFRQARAAHAEPADQQAIPHPRIGFAGVIDERFDIDLVRGVAELRPDWHLVMLGPVVKIDPQSLPQGPNIHYLGSKKYEELPAYLSGWDAAMLPFARNEATRFISPTKTPEYLAAGRRVVSTSIRDVVRGYGESGLVRIADEPAACVDALESMLADRSGASAWLARVDETLGRMSWDETFRAMWQLVEGALEQRLVRRTARARARVLTGTGASLHPAATPAAIPAARSA
jgi:UDP-galactopyranose mutase